MVDTRTSETEWVPELLGAAFEKATSDELDRRLEILSNQRRRFALLALAGHEKEHTLRDLAEQIVAWEERKLRSEVTEKERKRVSVSLYHVHLPKLEDAGIVEYTETSMVAVRPMVDIESMAPVAAIERELE